MQLKEFVQNTLVEIAEGIKQAQQYQGVGGQIAPSGTGSHDFPQNTGILSKGGIVSTTIEFDIGVTTSTTVSGSADSKGKIFVAEASGKIAGERSKSEISPVKFSVPFVFPENPNNWYEG